jgi:hypothetical protein
LSIAIEPPPSHQSIGRNIGRNGLGETKTGNQNQKKG